jgi:hypothetical protein
MPLITDPSEFTEAHWWTPQEVLADAPEWVSPQRWAEAACVLIEADTLDLITSKGLPRRPGVVVIAHDLDDGSIYRRATSIGAENTVLLPDGAHIVTRTILHNLNPISA